MNVETEKPRHTPPRPSAPYQSLPSVEKLASHEDLRIWNVALTHPVRVALAQEVIGRARLKLQAEGSAPTLAALTDELLQLYQGLFCGGMRPVINATGVVLHTNLGRAPLGKESLESLAKALPGYCTLEFDTETGERGKRGQHLEKLLCLVTGSSGALVVNNNAAALVLILHTLSAGRAVVVSRGELVQIGGGFRIPEILETTGAILREVGATNITRLKDYENAVQGSTPASLILKVHHSNFAMMGHTEEVSVQSLVPLSLSARVPLVFDIGSGALWDDGVGEPLVTHAVRQGVDLVCFSGDKLLGGPQAGIIVGSRKLIQRLVKSPLYRALRLGKVDLYLLERALEAFIRGESTPTGRMIRLTREELRPRAERIVEAWSSRVTARAIDGMSSIGGGTTPAVELPTVLIEVTVPECEGFARRLLRQTPSIVCRRENKRLLFDLRTISPTEESALTEGVLSALKG